MPDLTTPQIVPVEFHVPLDITSGIVPGIPLLLCGGTDGCGALVLQRTWERHCHWHHELCDLLTAVTVGCEEVLELGEHLKGATDGQRES